MLTKLRAAAAEENGFTLVELLIVIAILGVLAGVVVFSVAGIQDDSQVSACKAEASTVRAAEEAFYAKTKKYGSSSQLTTAPNKLLSAAPSMVTIALKDGAGAAVASNGASYDLTYVAACSGAGTP